MPILYVTDPGAMVRKDTGRLIVTKGNEELIAMPATRVEGVVVFGGAGVTTPALTFLLARGIELVFLSASGKFRGRLSADLSKNVALRRQQYRRADDEGFRLDVARAIVAGKLANCRVRCLEMNGRGDAETAATARDLQTLGKRAATAESRAELMGIEGQGTHSYFGAVRRFLQPPWVFERRARRPPPDPVNALISLLATMLHETCYGALEIVGLDPFCGFLHEERYGRASLALDLMEEFRPIIVDATALLLLHKRMLRPHSFVPGPNRSVRLTQSGLRIVADQYQQRLRTQLRPTRLTPRMTYQQLLEAQARHLRAVIEGSVPAYAPFRAR